MESRYPRTPLPAVLAVVPRGDAMLLVRRSQKPDRGKWGFPGGKVELGESLEAAAARELREETGVEGAPLAAFAATNVIDRDITGAVRYHFVLTAVLCRWTPAGETQGEGKAADDALETGWFTLREIETLSDEMVSADVLRIARLGFAIAKRGMIGTSIDGL